MPRSDFQNSAITILALYVANDRCDPLIYALAEDGMPEMRTTNNVVMTVTVRRVLRILNGTTLFVIQHGLPFPVPSFCQNTASLC